MTVDSCFMLECPFFELGEEKKWIIVELDWNSAKAWVVLFLADQVFVVWVRKRLRFWIRFLGRIFCKSAYKWILTEIG